MANETIAGLLSIATRQLAGSDTARLDAELLLAASLDRPRVYLFTWPERHIDPEQTERFQRLMVRRQRGEPVAHLLGSREFWSLNLKVDATTLIPRPDTELLVEQALARVAPTACSRLLDLGTGSGAIAIAMAKERPACKVTAVDLSGAALTVARENALRHRMTIEFLEGRWFEPLAGRRFDLILSNPPYIADQDPHLQQGDLRYEPRSALVSGRDGLDDIRHLVFEAPGYLLAGGWLLLEHGYDQAAAVMELLQRRGFQKVQGYSDLAGNPRVTIGCWG